MPDTGCRKISDIFNRKFKKNRGETVGKTFVNDLLRNHQYEIRILQRKMKHKKPKHVPRNIIWAIDLTEKTDASGIKKLILGIIEHGTRACLCLEAIENKSSLNLLRYLIIIIKKYGKPKYIRTDNESVFTSGFFRLSLWLLKIRHQTIDPCCPWQNGKIERFFGTVKERLNQWEVESLTQLNHTLGQFRFWYNFVRPHQHLEGKTPAEVWNKKDIFKTKIKREYWFEACDGLLTGYYLPI